MYLQICCGVFTGILSLTGGETTRRERCSPGKRGTRRTPMAPRILSFRESQLEIVPEQ